MKCKCFSFESWIFVHEVIALNAYKECQSPLCWHVKFISSYQRGMASGMFTFISFLVTFSIRGLVWVPGSSFILTYKTLAWPDHSWWYFWRKRNRLLCHSQASGSDSGSMDRNAPMFVPVKDLSYLSAILLEATMAWNLHLLESAVNYFLCSIK